MKIKLLIIFSVLLPNISISQNNFYGVIESYFNRELVITEQFGEESTLIQPIQTKNNGSFHFDFNGMQTGLYRIYLDNNESFDIIHNNEPNIEIYSRINNSAYSMLVIQSEENKQLYRFLRENMFYNYKIDLLTRFSEIYPDEKFVNKVISEKQTLEKRDRKNLAKVIKKNPNSFSGRYLSYKRNLNPPKKYNRAEQIEYLKAHYLNFYDFTDKEMIFSDAYTEVIYNYIMLYRDNPNALYPAAKEALDHVSGSSPEIFTFIFNYILRGFESLEMHDVCSKLAIEYGENCIDSDENLQLRIKAHSKLSVGNKAPSFIATDFKGNNINLAESQSSFIILFFWATWCEHCKSTIEDLMNIESYLTANNVRLISISLDSNKDELSSFLKEHDIEWTVIVDYKSWEGDIPQQFAIYATPTLILIDNDLTIIQKPYNIDFLYRKLNDIFGG